MSCAPLTFDEVESAYMAFVNGRNEPDTVCVHPRMMDRIATLWNSSYTYVRPDAMPTDTVRRMRNGEPIAVRFCNAIIREFRFVDRDELLFVSNGRTMGSRRIGVAQLP